MKSSKGITFGQISRGGPCAKESVVQYGDVLIVFGCSEKEASRENRDREIPEFNNIRDLEMNFKSEVSSTYGVDP